MMDEQLPDDERSVLERLEAAADQGEADVTRAELEAEVVRLYQEGDVAGMRAVAEALVNFWCFSPGANRDLSVDERKAVALDNLDFVTSVADKRVAVGDDTASAMALAAGDEYGGIGKVQQFYRDAVGFNSPLPPAPGLN